MAEQDFTIAEEFELPSKGLIYPVKFDPHIRLRSMTVRDELKRTNSQNVTVHKSLCEIIDSCMLDKIPIKCYDLAIGDYEYLLHKLRIVTYGPEYKMVVGCPHCSSVHETVISLDSLAVKPFDVKAFTECLSIDLPVSKKTVTIQFQTPRILDNVEVKAKEFKRKHPDIDYDPHKLLLLKEVILTVDGEKLTDFQLENFLNMLPARDANLIENRLDKSAQMIGLDTGVDVTCKSCGGDIKTFFRFGAEFFRPTTDE